MGRSWRIIQLRPNRSRNWPNRLAKNASCIGMKTSPPSASAEKMRVDLALVGRLSVRHHHADLPAQMLLIEAERLGAGAREIHVGRHLHAVDLRL